MKAILRKIFYITVLMFLFIIVKNVNVQAATASISASTTEPTEGQTVTVTANVTAGAWNLDLVGAGQNQKLYGFIQTNANASDSKTITFIAGSAGTTYTFTLTGDMTDINSTNSEPVNQAITITVKSSDTNTGNNNGNGNNSGGTTAKSTEARLRNLGITPNDFSGFRRDKTTYTVEVPNNVSQVKIYATALDSKATVTGTGTVNLKEGNNEFKITVTAEAGNTKTYTLNITRVSATEDTGDSEDENSEARLKNLGIKPEEYDFSGFKRDTTSYSIEVPNEVTEIEVYAEPVSSTAQVAGVGTVTLNEGANKIEVKVTAQDGTEMVYTLEVTRLALVAEEPESKEGLGLSSLIIKNFTLSPKFDSETYEYTIGLREDLTSLEIEAKANNSNAVIEIIGNENLKEGENIITILVSNAETEEYATYQIIVNKNAETETAGIVNWLDPLTWGLKEKIIVGVAILLVIIIIISIIIKVRLAKKEEEDFDLPGADELDKALIEHQELTDEIEANETETTVERYATTNNNDETDFIEEKPKSDIEKAQEYFESYTKRKGKHF